MFKWLKTLFKTIDRTLTTVDNYVAIAEAHSENELAKAQALAKFRKTQLDAIVQKKFEDEMEDWGICMKPESDK